MRELSLFTGAGGGVLGSKILGWECVGYVEYEKYCQEIIKQRITDGILDSAPIFGDIRKFNSEGYAGVYTGMVDIVTGGFPCQPFSVAGKRAGENDVRNMWPETIKTISIVRPKFAFLENVPGLISSGYFGKVLGDLAEAGYSSRWCVIGASDVGANHKRKRLWILAYTVGNTERSTYRNEIGKHIENTQDKCEGGELRANPSNGGIDVANPECLRELQQEGSKQIERRRIGDKSENVSDSDSSGRREQREQKRSTEEHSAAQFGGWWSIEPNVGRVVNGMANRVDRLRAIGNGQVPLAMAYAYEILSEGVIK